MRKEKRKGGKGEGEEEKGNCCCFFLNYKTSVRMRKRVTVITFSVCLSETDFEDGFILSLQTGIKALAGDCLNEALF